MVKPAEEPQGPDEKLEVALKRLLASRPTPPNSLRGLARELKMDSPAFLSRAIRGVDGKVASPELLSTIAHLLDVEPEWFAAVREAQLIAAIKKDSALRERLFQEIKNTDRARRRTR